MVTYTLTSPPGFHSSEPRPPPLIAHSADQKIHTHSLLKEFKNVRHHFFPVPPVHSTHW